MLEFIVSDEVITELKQLEKTLPTYPFEMTFKYENTGEHKWSIRPAEQDDFEEELFLIVRVSHQKYNVESWIGVNTFVEDSLNLLGLHFWNKSDNVLSVCIKKSDGSTLRS